VTRTATAKSVNTGANADSSPAAPQRVAQPGAPKPTDNELQQAVDQANKVLEVKTSNELQFLVDKSTGIAVVRMINQKTGETLLQFPSEAMLQIAKSIDQMTGAIIRKQA
jgi:flagellar protein FlaG